MGGDVGLGVGAGAGGELVDGAAGGDAVVFASATDVEVHGEGAVVAHVRLAGGAGGGVDVGDGGSAGDDGSGGHGCGLGGVGWGWAGEGTAKYPMDTSVAMTVAEKCIFGMVVRFLRLRECGV